MLEFKRLKYVLLNRFLKRSYSSKRKFCNRNILSLSDRGIFSDLFPDRSAGSIVDLLSSSPQTVYAGFDPTADSLHVGNLAILVNLMQWQRGGHQVIALIGGATGQIGDPSGKNSERSEITHDVIQSNANTLSQCITKLFEHHKKYFWDTDRSPLKDLKIVNNLEWYSKMNALDFVGRVGRNFRLGTMLLKQSVKDRLNSPHGISFTEFSYQILQAYDWLYLFKTENCRFQIGGHDQMGNIVAGYDLIQRIANTPVYGLTTPLITSEEGDKFGKSAGNAVWLSEEKTSPFELYQFLLRTKDSEVEMLLKLLTFENLSNILDMMEVHRKEPEKRHPQKKLAELVTLLVHGESGLSVAKNTTAVLYKENLDILKSLTTEEVQKMFHGATIADLLLRPGMTVMNAAMEAHCFPTESDAIRIISSGGFYINYKKVRHPGEAISPAAHILPNKITVFRVGKKNYSVIRWKI